VVFVAPVSGSLVVGWFIVLCFFFVFCCAVAVDIWVPFVLFGGLGFVVHGFVVRVVVEMVVDFRRMYYGIVVELRLLRNSFSFL
ncbi:hypothetical protein ACQWG3_24880, partial [Salmonella enterica subsp. enterica serovar Infantis]